MNTQLKKQGITLITVFILFLGTISYANASMYFPDITDDAVNAEAIDMLAEMGIVKGDENGNFNPDNPMSRAEFAVLICRLFAVEDDIEESTQSQFDDVPTEHWAFRYIAKVAELGLMNGYGDGSFGPSDRITYEQPIAVLVRALGYNDNALDAGGYPEGYIAYAQEMGIANDTDILLGSQVLRKTVAQLVFNAISFNGADF